MTLRPICKFLAPFACLLIFGSAVASAADPPVLTPTAGPWDAHGGFDAEKKVRRSISGIACGGANGTSRRCIVAFDEGAKVGMVKIKDHGYDIDSHLVRLDPLEGELDAEGVAADGQFYYLTGSYSVKRESCEINRDSRHVVRLTMDQTGRPQGPVTEASDSDRLLKLLTRFLPDFVGECLGKKHGVNIEGIAVRQGRLYFGFREPAIDGKTKILSVDAESFFTTADPDARIADIAIGKGRGIRDLKATADGILILAGPDDEAENANKRWRVDFWDGNIAADGEVIVPKELAGLELPEADGSECEREFKPEALEVLDESATSFHVVILSDGMCDGAPLEFTVHR